MGNWNDEPTRVALGPAIARSIWRNGVASVGLYLLPLALLVLTCWITGDRPWEHGPAKPVLTFLGPFLKNLNTWGLPALTLAVGVVEFFFGLYDRRWTRNEKVLDAVCFVAAKVVIRPLIVYFTLLVLPRLFPGQKGVFSWVPFWWGFFIIAVADDLTQYWYHRLHHQVPFMWRFHRTHHSAPYMGMSMAGRQNIIYTIFFSQIYLTAALTYLGLGEAALLVGGVKSLITLSAHSSIPWDKPFYKYRLLHPFAWVLERLISTPATHYAHHADSDDDGVGHYRGNFGNMFFLWDVLFGTGIITRRYPASFGLRHYKQEEWYAQFLWPIFKSRKAGSELARGGPMVGDFVDEAGVSVGRSLAMKPGAGGDGRSLTAKPGAGLAGDIRSAQLAAMLADDPELEVLIARFELAAGVAPGAEVPGAEVPGIEVPGRGGRPTVVAGHAPIEAGSGGGVR